MTQEWLSLFPNLKQFLTDQLPVDNTDDDNIKKLCDSSYHHRQQFTMKWV